jgi:hypothetical protein
LASVLIILNTITIALVLGMVVFLSRHSVHPFKASHEQLVQKVETSSNVQALKEMIIEDDSYIRRLERIANNYYSESCVFLVIVSLFPIASLGLLIFRKKEPHSL